MKLDRVIAIRNNKTIYRDGDKCIKVFGEKYLKSDILNEALNHSRIEETGLNIPKLLEVTTINGKWAIITEFIRGNNLGQLMAKNPSKINCYLEKLVEMQIEINKISSPLFKKLKDKMERKINLSCFDNDTKDLLHKRLKNLNDGTNICHGDFTPSNIMVSEDGKMYILDWSHTTQGNPVADIASSYLKLCLEDNEDLANEYLKIIYEKTDITKEEVQKWIPIVAAVKSVKGNEKEREFLKKIVYSIDL